MTSREDILITVDELATLLESQQDALAGAPRTRLLDVRWTLIIPAAGANEASPEPVGLADFRSGHIPTAVFVDLDGELAEHGAPEDGRHPLPSFDRLQGAARKWGINEGDNVVVYDGGGNLASARAWWLLRDAGLQVRLLDGSLPAWKRAELPVHEGEAAVVPGNVTLESGKQARLELAEVEQFVRDGGVLLDARAGERYRGEQEPIDSRAGHIPGALFSSRGHLAKPLRRGRRGGEYCRCELLRFGRYRCSQSRGAGHRGYRRNTISGLLVPVVTSPRVAGGDGPVCVESLPWRGCSALPILRIFIN